MVRMMVVVMMVIITVIMAKDSDEVVVVMVVMVIPVMMMMMIIVIIIIAVMVVMMSMVVMIMVVMMMVVVIMTAIMATINSIPTICQAFAFSEPNRCLPCLDDGNLRLREMEKFPYTLSAVQWHWHSNPGLWGYAGDLISFAITG